MLSVASARSTSTHTPGSRSLPGTNRKTFLDCVCGTPDRSAGRREASARNPRYSVASRPSVESCDGSHGRVYDRSQRKTGGLGARRTTGCDRPLDEQDAPFPALPSTTGRYTHRVLAQPREMLCTQAFGTPSSWPKSCRPSTSDALAPAYESGLAVLGAPQICHLVSRTAHATAAFGRRSVQSSVCVRARRRQCAPSSLQIARDRGTSVCPSSSLSASVGSAQRARDFSPASCGTPDDRQPCRTSEQTKSCPRTQFRSAGKWLVYSRTSGVGSYPSIPRRGIS